MTHIKLLLLPCSWFDVSGAGPMPVTSWTSTGLVCANVKTHGLPAGAMEHFLKSKYTWYCEACALDHTANLIGQRIIVHAALLVQVKYRIMVL